MRKEKIPEISSSRQNDDDFKVGLHNITLTQLTDSYLKTFNKDLALLKISNCQFDKIEKDAFDHLKHLNLLDLSNNKIKEKIHPQTFSKLPSLEILILKNVGIHDLELNLSNVEELILSENDIEDVKENSIQGHNVDYLDLSHNKIKEMNNSLKTMYKLSMIDLSKNNIEHVGKNVFEDNHNLLRILAPGNKLTSTEGFKLPKLKSLDLFGNKLILLKSNSFEKMFFLEELGLAANQIQRIEDPFSDLYELKFLNLAWNRIDEIKPSLFRNNLYLSHLSLQGNRIKSLKRFDAILNHLVKLDLSHNGLEVIDGEFFTSTPNLNVLDLSFNNIKVLSNSLQPLNNLKILDLAFNKINLTGFEFYKNHLLARVNLSSNGLEASLKNFKNNVLLTDLDLSNNAISNFCNSNVTFDILKKINLNGNNIKDLKCLKEKKFESLCVADLRNNPLVCGKDLDELVVGLAIKKVSPFKINQIQSDISRDQWQVDIFY